MRQDVCKKEGCNNTALKTSIYCATCKTMNDLFNIKEAEERNEREIKQCSACGEDSKEAMYKPLEYTCQKCIDLQHPPVKTCEECGEEIPRAIFPITNEYFYQCDNCARIRREREEKEKADRVENDRITRRDQTIRKRTPERFAGAHVETIDSMLFKDAFLIFGAFGTGKTYIAYALAHLLMMDGSITDFMVKRAFSMMMDIKSSFATSRYEETFKVFTEVPLLVVDEWGKNSGTDFEEAVLFEIINERYERKMRTGIIVNASEKEQLKTLIRPDVLDRFRGGIVEINGKSRR